jgi:hypothetical protein
MSAKSLVLYSILSVLLLVGTSIYFWALDFVNANLGISLAQAVDQELGAWQFTVWVMACILAMILVFNGVASGHHDLEPISSACYLGYTIVSLFIGCSAVTLNFPFNAFGSLDVQVTVDPAKMMALFGGGGGGGGPTTPISIGVNLFQLLMVSLSLAFAVLRFLRTLVKSRKEVDASDPYTYKSPTSPAPKKEAGSMDFMRNVRRD